MDSETAEIGNTIGRMDNEIAEIGNTIGRTDNGTRGGQVLHRLMQFNENWGRLWTNAVQVAGKATELGYCNAMQPLFPPFSRLG